MRLPPLFLLALALCAGAAVAPALAQDESESPPGPKKTPALPTTPFFASLMGSYTLADEDRGADDGYGAMFGIGRKISDEVALEASALYTRMDPSAGSGSSMQLIGGGLDAMIFPLVNYPNVYGVIGGYYGDGRHQPGPVASYRSAVIDTGAGVLFPLTHRILLRGDARLRMDFHNDKNAGVTPGNDRFFSETVFNLGVLIPFGAEDKAMPAAAEAPAQVVSATAEDSDNDGVPDVYDDCPGSPAGASVNEHGCELQTECRPPQPGEQVDENGCAAGHKFTLRGVTFEFDSDQLTPEAEQVLVGALDTLKAYDDIVIEIQGHTDWIGPEDYNQELSRRRAASVRRFLTAHGIPARHMRSKGFGESQPVDTNDTFEGREHNRRVEFRVLD